MFYGVQRNASKLKTEENVTEEFESFKRKYNDLNAKLISYQLKSIEIIHKAEILDSELSFSVGSGFRELGTNLLYSTTYKHSFGA